MRWLKWLFGCSIAVFVIWLYFNLTLTGWEHSPELDPIAIVPAFLADHFGISAAIGLVSFALAFGSGWRLFAIDDLKSGFGGVMEPNPGPQPKTKVPGSMPGPRED